MLKGKIAQQRREPQLRHISVSTIIKPTQAWLSLPFSLLFSLPFSLYFPAYKKMALPYILVISFQYFSNLWSKLKVSSNIKMHTQASISFINSNCQISLRLSVCRAGRMRFLAGKMVTEVTAWLIFNITKIGLSLTKLLLLHAKLSLVIWKLSRSFILEDNISIPKTTLKIPVGRSMAPGKYREILQLNIVWLHRSFINQMNYLFLTGTCQMAILHIFLKDLLVDLLI